MAINVLSFLFRNRGMSLGRPICLFLDKKNLHEHVTLAMPELDEVNVERPKKSKWLSYNDHIFPPQLPDEPRRPAYVCHVRENIKYSPKKMWYIACLVRGMSVEEALKQLSFVHRKGAIPVAETIKEARDLAVKDHNVEFPTNLWVAESFVGKGHVVKGIRRHAKMRVGEVEYKYCHYYVRLEEGLPPEHYYPQPLKDKGEILEKYIEKLRQRRIYNSL